MEFVTDDLQIIMSAHEFAQASLTSWQTKVWEVQSILLGAASIVIAIATHKQRQTQTDSLSSSTYYWIAWIALIIAMISSSIMVQFANLYVDEAQYWECILWDREPTTYDGKFYQISTDFWNSKWTLLPTGMLLILTALVSLYSVLQAYRVRFSWGTARKPTFWIALAFTVAMILCLITVIVKTNRGPTGIDISQREAWCSDILQSDSADNDQILQENEMPPSDLPTQMYQVDFAAIAAFCGIAVNITLTIIIIIVAVKQKRVSETSNVLTAFKHLQETAVRDARKIMITEVLNRNLHLNYTQWTDRERNAAALVSSSYSNIGILLMNDVLPKEIFVQHWMASIIKCYKACEPYIKDKQQDEGFGENYNSEFVWLYRQAVARQEEHSSPSQSPTVTEQPINRSTDTHTSEKS